MMPYHSTAYGWLTLAGIFVSIFLWSRVARRDNRLVLIYVAALAGAFLGAKIVYLAAEGWLHWHDANRWVVLATGKSITGALLGGYAAVEAAKRLLGYTEATGDWFAVIAPLGIMLGRVGCILQGWTGMRPILVYHERRERHRALARGVGRTAIQCLDARRRSVVAPAESFARSALSHLFDGLRDFPLRA